MESINVLYLYLDHRYGACKKCASAIQQPGLDHSFCSGCKSWISTKTASQISAPSTKAVERIAPSQKAAQLPLLLGGVK